MVFFDYNRFVDILEIEYLLLFYTMNIQKEIASVDINDSKWEALIELNQTLDFSRELEKYNITDLESSRLTIKNDGKKYIFAIDGQNAFCVGGKNTFENIVKEFYSQQTTEEINLVLEKTTLKVSILKNTNTTTTYQESNIEQPIDILTIQNRIDAYKEFFKAQVDDVKRDAFWLSHNTAGKEKAGYKITKEVAKSQLRILENMEKRLHKLQKKDRYSPDNQLIAEQEMAITLPEFAKQLDAFETSAPEFVKFQNDIVLEKADITSFDLRWSINNVAGAQRVLNILQRFNKQEIKLTTTTLELAKQEAYARDLLSLEKYLEKVIADGNFDPSVLQFTAKHQAAMNYLASDPTINGLLKTTPEKTTDGKTVVIEDDKLQEEYNKLTPNEKAQYTDRKDAFAKWGINGLTEFGLDQTKMSPEQKETWKGVGNLAVTGGLIFLWWKFISTAFKALSKSGREKLDKEWGWGWLWLPVAWTLASNALTWESPLALLTGGKGTEYLTNLFGGKTGEKNSVAETYTSGVTGACALFEGRTCAEVAGTIETDSNGKMKLKPSFYNDIISTAKWVPSDSKKLAAAQFLEKVGQDDPNNLIHTTLTAIGLSEAVLRDSNNANTSFNEKAAGAIARLASVTEYMERNQFDRINKDQMYLIQDYIANKDGKIEDLDALQKRRWDVFEDSVKAPDEATKEQRKQKVNTLALTDTEKQELLSSIRNFWIEWPLSKDLKQLDIQQKGNYIELTTYGKTTKIDIKNKTIVGLEDVTKSSIRFQSTYELLKVANLTNRIFDLVKNNQNPVAKDPFNVSWVGQDIEYNNTKFWSNPVDRFNHMDITVASGGYGGSLGKISPILETQKDGFVAYLNTRYNKPITDAETKKSKEEADKKKQEEAKKKQAEVKKNTIEKK